MKITPKVVSIEATADELALLEAAAGMYSHTLKGRGNGDPALELATEVHSTLRAAAAGQQGRTRD